MLREWLVWLGIGLALIAAGLPDFAMAQAIDTNVEIARDGATVGDLVTVTVHVTHPSDTTVEAPSTLEPLADFDPAIPKITQGRIGDRLVTKVVYRTRTFALGMRTLSLPALTLRGGAGTLQAIDVPAQTLTVLSVLPTSADDLVPRPLKLPESAGRAGAPWPTIGGGVGAGIALIVIGGAGWRWGARRRHGPAAPTSDPALLAVNQAERELANITPATPIAESSARLDIIVRNFLAARYRVPARNLTILELSPRLAVAGAPARTAQMTAKLCAACDAVAYANDRPSTEQIRRQIDLARTIITVDHENGIGTMDTQWQRPAGEDQS